ncbi:ABC transporter permease subunit [Amphritea sp.]|uniref:branched-chain amino acid ABC transporter ATP-binding protein/permease n=1 Tax=Amphritea sp. TaxID=1872502 RepID=UPI003A950374
MKLFPYLFKNAGIVFPVLIAAIGMSASGWVDPYFAFVASSWVIFGLLGLSLDIVWGRGGFLSLGQTAFYGLGGYFGSVVAINYAQQGNSLLWALPAGGLFGVLCATFLGYIIFYARMGALQSTILSYTFTLLLWSVSQSFKWQVGEALIAGDSGLSNIPGITLGIYGNNELLDPNDSLFIAILVSLTLYLLTKVLMSSYFGRIIDCIRIDEEKTELLGYNVRQFKLLNFIYAGGIAGIAGALFALWSNFLNPSIFSIQEALLVPIYVLVGGLGTLFGPFVGAITIGALSFYLGGGAIGTQTTLILGATLIFLVLFLKHGLLGTLRDFCSKYLPDPNQASRESKPVKIDTDVLNTLMNSARKQVGPAKKLITDGLYKRFGGVVPVNSVSRTFIPGRPYSLIGPNGAGKSSFLKTCVGMYRPDSGHIYIDDQDVSRAKIYQRVNQGLGVKNQRPQVFGELTVYQNLWIAAYSRTRRAQSAHEMSLSVVAMLGLSNQKSVQAGALSHGQQQWLDIGMVLCLTPRILLLDEPAAGMTNEETRELSQLIRTLAEHMTVVVVEHDMEFIRTLEGHVTVLHQGEVFAEGNIQALRNDDSVLDIYLGRRAHV